ncbi:Flp pilus assembly protein CpaB [Caldibacillus lycopersici]|uniref:Flp pilus assembly protein CpaB n=1 Tax=Perspicuibacillus lycopersici TaxID=1325689 RepID=A0AAE3IWV7_9BACI|nr:Flp pilus assembly protein CpaB [Perspicuibacillus lycopersici]MCU9613530.1 Flp pilus assembly protein CpaB [Perspicuibacillus lycopersici]
MNNKKIWMYAIISGLIMSVIFYFATTSNNHPAQKEPVVAMNENVSDETDKNGETNENELSIEAGKRAMSIPVDQVQSVSGFVEPGSFVDIVAVLPDATTGEKVSKILLSHVKVLATGKDLQPNSEETEEAYQMVTIEVLPEDGARISFAKEMGVLTLMLEGSNEQ